MSTCSQCTIPQLKSFSDNQQQLGDSCSCYPQQCLKTGLDIHPDNLGQIADQFLNNIGASKQACKLSSFDAAVSGSASMGPMSLGGSAQINANLNSLQKSGCSDLAIVLQNLYNSVAQAKCVITNLGNSSTTTTTVSQLISFTGGDNLKVTFPPGCSNPTWTQDATVTFNSFSNINSSVAQTLSSIAQQGLKNTVDQLQANKQGYASTTSGGVMVQGLQNIVSNKDFQTGITKNVSTILNSVNDTQSMPLIVGNNVEIQLPCTLSQTSLIDLQAASIITAAYTGDFASQLSAFLDASVKQKQENVSSGVEALFDAFKNNWSYIIAGIIFVIVGVMVLKFLKSKEGQKLVQTGIKSATAGKTRF